MRITPYLAAVLYMCRQRPYTKSALYCNTSQLVQLDAMLDNGALMSRDGEIWITTKGSAILRQYLDLVTATGDDGFHSLIANIEGHNLYRNAKMKRVKSR